MLVVFGKENADKLRDRMTVLELDTFMQSGLENPITVYAVIEMEDIPVQDLPQLENLAKMHNTMWEEYRARRFSYCEQAMEHLRGRWKGVLDSFYEEFGSRIMNLQDSDIPENWDGVIYKNVPTDLIK